MTGIPDWRSTPAGVEFVGFAGRPLPSFPVAPGSDDAARPAVRLLEELWGRNLLGPSDNRAVLRWMSIYELDPHERATLGLPEPDRRLRAKIATDLWMSHQDFQIQIEFSFGTSGSDHIPAITREGLLFDSPAGPALPPRKVGELTLLVDGPMPMSAHERGILIAKVKRIAAQSTHVELDHYLEKEDYVLPQRLGLEVEALGPDEIRLHPTVEGVDANEFRGFVDGPPKTRYTRFLPEGRRRRLVLQPRQRDAIGQIRETGTLRGADVPAFFDNPEAFLPDEIEVDLSDFSDRVRGLVPVVYHSQPYIAVDRTKRRGWFDAWPRVGVTRRDDGSGGGDDAGTRPVAAESEQETELTPEEFRELMEEAEATGGRYARYRDGWIEIDPERASRFLDFCEDHPEADDGGRRRVSRASAQLVLDVIPNTDALEYVEPDVGSAPFPGLQEYELPRSLKATLYPHQEIGYRWMRHLHASGCGGLLADDMGLGKTVQLIAFMSHLHDLNGLRPALLVVPLSVMVNWQRELERFAPGIGPVHHHRGSNRIRNPHRLARNEVVITTYATLRRDQIMLAKIDWTVAACDEAQNVKNPTANVTSAVKGMKASFRLACTGTPVENGLSELWCIVDFAQPGRLGSRREFRDNFERPLVDALDDTEDQEGHVARLRERLHPHYIRRTKEEALKLPPKTERRYEVGMSQRQEAGYDRILASLRRKETHPLAALQHLIAVCSHPLTIRKTRLTADPERLLEDAPKLRETVGALERIRREGAKVVIYTRLKAMQRILQTVILHRFGFDPSVLNGEVGGHNRHRIVESFNKGPGFDAMILSPEAAGVGLNITGATHVVHYTRLWNPAKENQATDRVHRIGQNHPVTIHYPIVVGNGFKSVEQHLHDLLREKLQLARNVLVPRKSLDFMGELERRVTRGDGP